MKMGALVAHRWKSKFGDASVEEAEAEFDAAAT